MFPAFLFLMMSTGPALANDTIRLIDRSARTEAALEACGQPDADLATVTAGRIDGIAHGPTRRAAASLHRAVRNRTLRAGCRPAGLDWHRAMAGHLRAVP